MNERIKELAIEAGMIVGEANGFDMTRFMPREVKFAELIVRECAEVCDRAPFGNDYYADRIKEHFGVK